jgi:serine phosphatase RsbU (regulator of sigma subunit)
VGLLESYNYEQGCVSLAEGDILVAYTDGISEAMNASDEEWGEANMMGAVKLCDGLPGRKFCNAFWPPRTRSSPEPNSTMT